VTQNFPGLLFVYHHKQKWNRSNSCGPWNRLIRRGCRCW